MFLVEMSSLRLLLEQSGGFIFSVQIGQRTLHYTVPHLIVC